MVTDLWSRSYNRLNCLHVPSMACVAQSRPTPWSQGYGWSGDPTTSGSSTLLPSFILWLFQEWPKPFRVPSPWSARPTTVVGTGSVVTVVDASSVVGQSSWTGSSLAAAATVWLVFEVVFHLSNHLSRLILAFLLTISFRSRPWCNAYPHLVHPTYSIYPFINHHTHNPSDLIQLVNFGWVD